MTVEVVLTEIAQGLGFPESPLAQEDGSVLVSEVSAGRVSRVVEGRTEVYADLGGGPNGLLAEDAGLLVCQNGGASWAEVAWPFDLPGAVRMRLPHGPPRTPVPPAVLRVATDGSVSTVATEFTTATGQVRPLSRPSDICSDGHGGFYLTDAGATRDRRRELMGLLHGRPDGTVTEILYPLEMPNGVAMAPDGATLYLTETRTRRVWRIALDGPGRVSSVRGFATVDSGGPMNFGGADGVCVDPSGYVVVATLGSAGLSVYDPAGRLRLWIPTGDPMTTNASVDPWGDRLVVSLASTGRLVAVERWSSVLAAVRAGDAAVSARVSWR
jgi:gluconolactonase